MPQIEVTFNIDVNGILTVSAKDKATGKENKITVQNAGGLSKDEIEKMKRDAEAHAAEDKKRREVIDLKNQGEYARLSDREIAQGYGDKVSADVRGQIESALNNLRDALKSDDGDRIKKTMDNLHAGQPEAGRRDVQGDGGQGRAALRRRRDRGGTGGPGESSRGGGA